MPVKDKRGGSGGRHGKTCCRSENRNGRRKEDLSKKRHGFSGPGHLLEESPLTAMDCSSVPAVISHSWEWLRELWPQQGHRGRSRGAVAGGSPSVLPPAPGSRSSSYHRAEGCRC